MVTRFFDACIQGFCLMPDLHPAKSIASIRKLVWISSGISDRLSK
jgi:hypothetical protein